MALNQVEDTNQPQPPAPQINSTSTQVTEVQQLSKLVAELQQEVRKLSKPQDSCSFLWINTFTPFFHNLGGYTDHKGY